KIVAFAALAAVLALGVGFAQAKSPVKDNEQLLLRSSVALVQDAASGQTLYAKNQDAPVPIASITKLMTALVILERKLDPRRRVVISDEDYDAVKGTNSRLPAGSVFTRDQLMLLALMSSENRAAAALGRTFPGGTPGFVAAMNEKARALGMSESRFVDASGLSPGNVSSARDLARLLEAAHRYPVIRDYSTRKSAKLNVSGREQGFRNTNGLVRSVNWDIGLSKTGYTSEAGRCLVMRVRMQSRELIVVLLDSWGKHSRIGDANRIRKWLETHAARGPAGRPG
ncbi:MAG: peptidase, partial [Betaproteobacteria bacterium]|nr:peptidase [Betaproteobacteria bacterium]